MRSQEGHLRRIEIWWIVLVQHFSLSHLDWLADTLKQAKRRLDAEDHFICFQLLFDHVFQEQFREAGSAQYHKDILIPETTWHICYFVTNVFLYGQWAWKEHLSPSRRKDFKLGIILLASFNQLSYDMGPVCEDQGAWNLRQIGPMNCLTEYLQRALAALRNWNEKVQFILSLYSKICERLNYQKQKKIEVFNFSWIYFQYFPYRPSVLQIIPTQIMAKYTSTILHKRRTTTVSSSPSSYLRNPC